MKQVDGTQQANMGPAPFGTASLFALFFIPGLLFIVLSATLLYTYEADDAIKLIVQKNKSLDALQNEAIQHDFRNTAADLLYLSEENSLLESLGHTEPSEWRMVAHNFEQFEKRKGTYSQIRYIDRSGTERIRVDYSDGRTTVAPAEVLQSVRQRYYFRHAIGLGKNMVYVSPFDLDLENGKIIVPYQPTIRFATPVFDKDGHKAGILIINYLGSNLLNRFVQLHENHPKLSHLLNAQGYWMHGNSSDREWGFMFPDKKQDSFAHDYPQEWQRISSGENGDFETPDGLFTFTTVHPLQHDWISSSGNGRAGNEDHSISSADYYWKIVELNSPTELATVRLGVAWRQAKWAIPMLLLLTLASVLLAITIGTRQRAEFRFRQSEKRKTAIHRISPDCIVTANHNGIILEFNEAAEQTFGYAHDKVIGRSLVDSLVPPRLHEAFVRKMKRMSRPGRHYLEGKTIETTAHNAAGEEFPVEVTVTRIPDEEPPVFTGFIRDISERKHIQQRLSIAVEQAGEAIIITDANGCIEYANQAFSDMTGYTSSEVKGKNPSILKSGKQDEGFYRQMWQTISSGKVWQGRIVDRRKDGGFFPTALTITPIRNAQGEITNYVGHQQDIHEYEDMEAQFHQAQKMEAIGTLVGGIAHDFNNTLAGIVGNLYLARKASVDKPQVVEKLNRIEKLSFRASNMIKQLLAFSRRDTVEKQPLSLPSFLKEIIKLHRVSIPENIELRQNIEQQDMLVLGDVNQLQQVLLNLINNARDALEGVDKPRIEIGLHRFIPDAAFRAEHPDAGHDAYARITLSDNGSGIAPGDVEHIFEPFFTTKTVGRGTGLGLAMVYGAIQTHEGVVSVRSGEDRPGTSFDIFLPLVTEKAEAPPAPEPAAMAETGHGETVLLVDDNQNVLETAREVLEGLNYRVLTATTGTEAVALYEKQREQIDLLILDVVMPEMGGVEALEHIRRINPQVKAIFATGYDPERMGGKRHQLRNEVVLAKPFNVDELSRLMRRMLAS